MNVVTIYKCDSKGRVCWQYQGQVISHESNIYVIDSIFNRHDTPFQEIIIKTGDHFIETFFTDRWYNIFEIHDREEEHLKGWYCNIGRPVILKNGNKLFYEDLGLDLWVRSDGTQKVLDEDEFAVLNLDEFSHNQALQGLTQLQDHFYRNFERIRSASNQYKANQHQSGDFTG